MQAEDFEEADDTDHTPATGNAVAAAGQGVAGAAGAVGAPQLTVQQHLAEYALAGSLDGLRTGERMYPRTGADYSTLRLRLMHTQMCYQVWGRVSGDRSTSLSRQRCSPPAGLQPLRLRLQPVPGRTVGCCPPLPSRIASHCPDHPPVLLPSR